MSVGTMIGLRILDGIFSWMTAPTMEEPRKRDTVTIIEQVHVDSVRCVCMETIVKGTETGEKFKMNCPYVKPIEIKLRANKEIYLRLKPDDDYYTLDRKSLILDTTDLRVYQLPNATHRTPSGNVVTNKTKFKLGQTSAWLEDYQVSTQVYPMLVTSRFSCYNPIVPVDTLAPTPIHKILE